MEISTSSTTSIDWPMGATETRALVNNTIPLATSLHATASATSVKALRGTSFENQQIVTAAVNENDTKTAQGFIPLHKLF